MRAWMLAAVLGCTGLAAAAQPLPRPAFGTVQRLENVPSRYVDARHVDVWLPEGYGTGKRYDVLYLQDGQMLFDPATAGNHPVWRVDAALSRLVREGRIPEAIVVGIWNDGARRHSEYVPQKFLPYLPEGLRASFVEQALDGLPRSDAYLRFLVTELKPLVDSRFATRPEREHTFVMGADAGALIALYAVCEYPSVFGGAAALSTDWIGMPQANAALPLAAFNYLQARLPDPSQHRLYMDRGTEGPDALNAVPQQFVDQIVRDRGYGKDNVLSLVFDGTGHDEAAWAARLDLPLLFLLSPP